MIDRHGEGVTHFFVSTISIGSSTVAVLVTKILGTFLLTVLKELPPASLHRNISSPSEDSKLVVMVTGVTDLDNLPSPGDPGAPMPPDEVDAETGHHRPQTHQANSAPNTPPPSYSSDLPPPYTE